MGHLKPSYIFHLQENMEQSQFEELSFTANYIKGLNALGGILYIRDEVAVFKAHKFNFGDSSEKVIPISEICGYKKGLLTFMNIYLNNEETIKLAVWKKDAIINALEERRHAIFQRLGKETPRLSPNPVFEGSF